VSPSLVLCRARLDGLQQGVVSQVAVTLRGLIAGMSQHLADREQIDTNVDRERCRRFFMRPKLAYCWCTIVVNEITNPSFSTDWRASGMGDCLL